MTYEILKTLKSANINFMKLQLPKEYLNPPKLLKYLKDKPESFWIKRGEKMALKLFKEMSQKVPAYKDFLKKRNINPDKIKSFRDFQQIPTIDKQNYLRQYPLDALCWNGEFKQRQWTISTTSGSTGEPFYFPRQDLQDWQYAAVAELYLLTNFNIDKKATLYIDAFPMGPWIGGLFTYQAIKYVAARGNYQLSIITTSVDKNAIIGAVKKLGNYFDQIIIGCYGPFLKDAIDDGIREGINWKKYNLKFVFSAEGFTETFRDYIIKKTGLKNPYKDTLNHYGTVDLGTMSYETPFSILIRRLAVKNPDLYDLIFPVKYKLPTLTQFMPDLFFFEEQKGGLICSAYSGLPLVRYDLKDNGGVISFDEVIKRFSSRWVDLLEEARKAKIADTVWQLPFVYVYERQDFSVSFYAFQIYPETIKRALQHSALEDFVTGKFTMLVKFDENQNQYLEINIELKYGIKKNNELKNKTTKIIIRQLLKENSEFRKTYSEIPDKATPKIVFWPYEHPLYFKSGGKQKWVKK